MSNFYIGSNDIKKMYVNGVEAKKAYYNGTQLYPSTPAVSYVIDLDYDADYVSVQNANQYPMTIAQSGIGAYAVFKLIESRFSPVGTQQRGALWYLKILELSNADNPTQKLFEYCVDEENDSAMYKNYTGVNGFATIENIWDSGYLSSFAKARVIFGGGSLDLRDYIYPNTLLKIAFEAGFSLPEISLSRGGSQSIALSHYAQGHDNFTHILYPSDIYPDGTLVEHGMIIVGDIYYGSTKESDFYLELEMSAGLLTRTILNTGSGTMLKKITLQIDTTNSQLTFKNESGTLIRTAFKIILKGIAIY